MGPAHPHADEPAGVKNSLETFIEGTRLTWGTLTSELVADIRARIEALAKAPVTEGWLAALQQDRPAARELYRDPVHGFVLLAHAEALGKFWSPHDHGRSWVVYAVHEGETEIATYARVPDPEGRVRLVRREVYRLRPGEARVFLPGDIHAVRCTSASILYYRFTSRDLKDQAEGQLITRYVERDGVWTVDV